MDTPRREQLSFGYDVGLEEIFAFSSRQLVMQLYGVTGDYAEAEDVVQEAFVRAVAAGHRFARSDHREAWLRTTAINLHHSRWRRLRHRSRVGQRPAAAVDVPGLDERLDVIEALRALPPREREVVALQQLADLPVAEIAQELGLSLDAVTSSLGPAREALALALREEPRGHV